MKETFKTKISKKTFMKALHGTFLGYNIAGTKVGKRIRKTQELMVPGTSCNAWCVASCIGAVVKKA